MMLFPKVLLPLKGRLDARKGPGAVRAYVDKTARQLAARAAREELETEKALEKTRQDAARCLAERKRALEQLAVLPAPREPDSTEAIRANRRDKAERERLRAVLAACGDAIVRDSGVLNDAQARLSAQLAGLYAQTGERLALYVMGVRSGPDMKDFEYERPEDWAAPDICPEKHRTLDEEIRRVAEELLLEGKEAA